MGISQIRLFYDENLIVFALFQVTFDHGAIYIISSYLTSFEVNIPYFILFEVNIPYFIFGLHFELQYHLPISLSISFMALWLCGPCVVSRFPSVWVTAILHII